MTAPLLIIAVRGTPAPQGSKKFVGLNAAGHGRLIEQSRRTAPWRDLVRAEAWAAVRCCPDPECSHLAAGYPLDEPVAVAMTFTMPKPASAPKTRRSWPSGRPDLSKLARAVEDSLTDVGVWKDDARVISYVRLAKVYPGEGQDALPVPGVLIRVWRWVDLHAPQPLAQMGWGGLTLLPIGSVAKDGAR